VKHSRTPTSYHIITMHRYCVAHVMGRGKCAVAAVINLNRCNPDETRSKNRYLPAPARPESARPNRMARIANAEPWLPAAKQLKLQTTQPVGFSGFCCGGLVLLLRGNGLKHLVLILLTIIRGDPRGRIIPIVRSGRLSPTATVTATHEEVDLVFCELRNVSRNRTVPNTVFYPRSLDLARTACPCSGRNPQPLVHKRWPTPLWIRIEFFWFGYGIFEVGIASSHTRSPYFVPVRLCTSRGGRPIRCASSFCGWFP
jgi:hypothetical protein